MEDLLNRPAEGDLNRVRNLETCVSGSGHIVATGTSIYHYATRNDYELVIAEVNSRLNLKYAVDEWRLDANYRVYRSPLDAPEFGVSEWGWSPAMMLFVLMENAALPFSHRPQRQVPEKYGFDLSLIGNPPSYWWIHFHASGLHKSAGFGEGLIQGWLSTNSNHPDSKAIFKAFKSVIKKRFLYVKHYGVYVGPEAARYAQSGGRLSDDLRRSTDADVKLPEAVRITPL